MAIARMERELKDLPARKNDISSQLDHQKSVVAEAEENLKKGQVELKTIEENITDCREKISKFREQQLQLKTNEEFKAMEKQIKALEDKISEYEDDQLKAYDVIETLNKKLAEEKEELNDQESRVSEEIKALDERCSGIESEIESVRAERNSLAENIDEYWLTAYQRVANAKPGSALVKLNNNVCGGCHMQVPYQLSQDIKRQDDIVSCNYCGRMLY